MNEQGQQNQTSETEQFIIFAAFVVVIFIVVNYVPDVIGIPLLEVNLWVDGIINMPISINYNDFIPYARGDKRFTLDAVELLNSRIAKPTFGVVSLIVFLYYFYKFVKIIKSDKDKLKKLNLEELLVKQATYFKFMKPVAITDRPDKHSLIKGRWARAQKPYEFITDKFGFKHKNDWDLNKVEKELTAQLGLKVTSLDDIKASKLHIQIMLVIFSLRILVRRDESNELIDSAAVNWCVSEQGKTSFTGGKTKKLVFKHLGDVQIIKVINRLLKEHGYINTLIAGAMSRARSSAGKISTPEFIWLKPTDRILFYTLNQLGRREVWIEAIGATSHYKLELEAKSAFHDPQIVSAVAKIKSLSFELKDDIKKELSLFEETWSEVKY